MFKKIKNTIFLTSLLLFWFFSEEALGGTEHNVRGWAWSSNIGWILFNNLDYPSPTSSNFGVKIDPQTGNLSGYAWSPNIGWISFNTSDLSGCPTSNCEARVKNFHQLGQSRVELSGWARVLSPKENLEGAGGWSGWISLNGTSSNGTNYKVEIDEKGDFHGWAWSDMVVGWISFNSANHLPTSSPSYKVWVNLPAILPSASDLVSNAEYCLEQPGVAKIAFTWTYTDPSGTISSGYHLQVQQKEEGEEWKTVVNCEISTQGPSSGEKGSSAVYVVRQNTSPILPLCENDNGVNFGKYTRWRIRVKNAFGLWSQWTDWHPSSNGFLIAPHPYPWVDIDYSPRTPTVGETVKFFARSQVFSSPQRASFFWTFQGGTPPTSTLANPTTTFSSIGEKIVSLKVTDASGFSCEKSITISVRYPLPKWKEIPPSGKLFWKNIIAAFSRFLKNLL